jgi:hypothetical protein
MTADDVTSVFDGADRLVARTEAGAGPERPGTTLYFYWGMGATLAEETDGAGNTVVRYACATTGAAIAQQSYRIANGAADPSGEGTSRWLLSDADANVATVVGDDGAVVEQKAFDPYGAPQAAGSTTTDARASSSTLGFQGAITGSRNRLGGARATALRPLHRPVLHGRLLRLGRVGAHGPVVST